MKKKIMGLIAIVAIAVVAGYNIYTSQSNMRMSALVLANVEALARYELPDVEITCNQFKNDSPGRCWHVYKECSMGWFIHYDDCRFSGSIYDSCLTPCD
ncbi:NVEALA domain-containing protein [uncultured Bacteroides sp.]|uniref:NVEALA domain-containing protein n=2 Tax=uncultured Bacteroides sp. TaxID=162156 RepID=UPI0025E5184F|nr:NVEALA domain-containing protein [uncultured Bacteroides sp.]